MTVSPDAKPPFEGAITLGEAIDRARAAFGAGNKGRAERLCRDILKALPGQPDASHMLGLIAYSAGHLDAAIVHLNDACKAPRAPATWFSDLSEMLRQRGRLVDAETAARRAVSLAPNLPGALNNLGIILQELGKFDESGAILEKLVQLEPNNAEAHNNLGNTLKFVGDLKGAQTNWDRALALRPGYAEVYSNMSLLLTEQAQYDRAADAARRAIHFNPRLGDAYINLATVETARLRHGEALRHLDALLTMMPDHVVALSARSTTLKHLDRLEEALASAEHAVRLDPQKAEAHNALGTALQALGRLDDAQAAFRRSAEVPGKMAEKARVNLALLFMEHGKAAEAETEFNSVVAAFPKSASAWFNRADLVKFMPGDPSVDAMQGLLATGESLSHTDRMLLNFALGKAFLEIGDSDRAFRHLETGNTMKRATFAYDSAATRQWMRSIEEVFTPVLIDRLSGQGASSNMPIFVVGMPRSGTTLIEQILASHRDIIGAGELRFIQRIVDAIPAYPQMVETLTAPQLEAMGAQYLSRVLPLAKGRTHVVDKMPANMLFAGLIHLMLPNARIIHARRDPVDTCLSCYSKLFASEQAFAYDLAELGEFHLGYQHLMAHWKKVLPASSLLDVDYESVVDDLEPEARRMVEFLGLDWDPNCLEFHQTQRAIRTASVNQVRKPIYRTSSGRWRKHKANLGPLLEALNVSPSAPTSVAT